MGRCQELVKLNLPTEVSCKEAKGRNVVWQKVSFTQFVKKGMFKAAKTVAPCSNIRTQGKKNWQTFLTEEE